jgi:hypothetical protein
MPAPGSTAADVGLVRPRLPNAQVSRLSRLGARGEPAAATGVATNNARELGAPKCSAFRSATSPTDSSPEATSGPVESAHGSAEPAPDPARLSRAEPAEPAPVSVHGSSELSKRCFGEAASLATVQFT